MPWEGWSATVAGLVAIGSLDLSVIARRKGTVTVGSALGYVLGGQVTAWKPGSSQPGIGGTPSSRPARLVQTRP